MIFYEERLDRKNMHQKKKEMKKMESKGGVRKKITTLLQGARGKREWVHGFLLGSLVLGVALGGAWWFQRTIPSSELSSPSEPETVALEQASLLKVGFVTDWEYGEKMRLKQKITSQAPIELRRVVNYFNQTFLPDIVVGGGDYIESSNANPVQAKQQLARVNEIFSQVKAPRMYVFGDHDFRKLTQDEIQLVLGLQETHAWRDIGEWRIVTIDPNYDRDNQHRNAKQYVFGHMSPGELEWLREALRTDRPVLVFSHYNVIPVPNSKGAYILNVDNADAVRAILEEAGNVAAVVSGHNPMGYYEKRNGIHYFVVDTLVNRKAMGSFATIEARYLREQKYAHIFLRQYGANKVQYSVDGKIGESDIHLITSPPFEWQLSDELSEAELMDQ